MYGSFSGTRFQSVSHLEVVLLDVGPEELHELAAGGLLLADDVRQLGAELLGCGDASSRHC